jgi:hypothetical protein
MGFLDSILGHGHKDHPPLDDGSAAARRLDAQRESLEQFAAKVKDKLELVPDSDAVYIFVGKPPGTFGIAWLKDGAEHNLKTMIQQRGLAPASAQTIAERLRETYEAHQQAERYSRTVAGRTVTVTPSEAFAADIRRIIIEIER